MRMLRPIDRTTSFLNGMGFFKQTPSVVELVKKQLLDLIKKQFCVEGIMFENIGYYIDNSVFYRSWTRLMCIDEKGKEWGQIYFVTHPSERTNRELIVSPQQDFKQEN